MIAEHGGTRCAGGAVRRVEQDVLQAVAVIDVVAEDQRRRLARHEIGPDDVGLRQAFGLGLLAVGERHAPLGAIAEQPLEVRQILRRRDDQHLAYAGQHQGRQRVIDHRLVVDRQELLRRHERHRMQPRTAAAGQDDAFHGVVLVGAGVSMVMRRATHWAAPSCQSGRRRSKAVASLVVSRRELAGRRAGVG